MTAKRKKDTSFSKHRKCRLTDASCLSMPVQSLFTKLLNSLVCNFPEFRALKMAYFAVILHQCEDERITSNGIEYRYRLPPNICHYTHTHSHSGLASWEILEVFSNLHTKKLWKVMCCQPLHYQKKQIHEYLQWWLFFGGEGSEPGFTPNTG